MFFKADIGFLMLFISVTGFGQAGYLDNSFGTGGIVSSLISNDGGWATGIDTQSDGKIVVSCISDVEPSSFVVMRFNSDGSVDNTFGVDGEAIIPIGSLHSPSMDIEVQDDDKIVIVGYDNNGINYDIALVRLNPAGSVDNTFDLDGIVITDISGTNDYVNSVSVQNDGKIVVVGETYNGVNFDFLIARYNSDGTLDTSFDGDGIVTTDIDMDYGNALDLQSDNKIVSIGYSQIGSLNSTVISRYNTDGSLDLTFGSSGTVITDFGTADSYGRDVKIQNDGKILLTGGCYNPAGSLLLARLNPDGSFDASFDGDGIAYAGTDSDEANALSIQSDGRIIVVGKGFDSSNDFIIARFNVDGSLDNSFHVDGINTTDFDTFDDEAYAVKIQQDGKILVAGESYDWLEPQTFVAISRYHFEGAINLEEKDFIVGAYPNPTIDGTMFINSQTSLDQSNLFLFNSTGQLLQSYSGLTGNSYQLDISMFPDGVYILTFQEEDKTQHIRIVKG